MTEIELQVELQLGKSPSGQQAHGGRAQEDMSELDGALSLLADVALAPPSGDHEDESREVRDVERSLQSTQLQHLFLMSKANDLHDCLVDGQCHSEREGLAAVVKSFLSTCQPYFNHLESTAQRFASRHTPLAFTVHSKLLVLSQQLCDKLEQLVLTYARHSLFCLDETEPNSMSHFCIGQSQLGPMRLTVFRYCRPTPYLARVDTGLYKRMRWNVERIWEEQQQRADEEQDGGTEYYFLCCEDIPNESAEAAGESQGIAPGKMERMWSIGRWVQVTPDPDTEDIEDWIMCEVPQATYHRLLYLGSDEPTSCDATELVQHLLFSQQTTE